MEKTNKKRFWELAFSGDNGFISSKRIFGGIIILTVLMCTIVLVFKEGGTNTVQDLLITEIFVGGGLLGLSSVTSIWKRPIILPQDKEHKTDIPSNKNGC